MRRRGRKLNMRGRRKPNSYNAMKWFKETKKGVDIEMPVNPVTGTVGNLRLKLAANFEDISDTAVLGGIGTKAAMRVLFGRYCITGVKYTFIPKYVSSDSTGRASDRVVYAINRDPTSSIGDEETVLRQNDAKFTNTSRKFSVYVKHPEPVIFSTSATANRRPDQAPIPIAQNQVVASPSTKKWTWLPTRVIEDDPANPLQHPDHVGLDVHITCQNTAEVAPYVVYTMFKTVYFAFKEQD